MEYDVNQPTPQALKEYIADIKSGKKSFKTKKDLKDFWLFAIEQYKKHPESQCSIAYDVRLIGADHPMTRGLGKWGQTHMEFVSLEYLNSSPRAGEGRMAYSRRRWRLQEKKVRSFLNKDPKVDPKIWWKFI